MNREYERHIKAAEDAGKIEGANALRGLQITFNALVQSQLIEELPADISTDQTENLFFNFEGKTLPVTREVLENPSYLKPLLEFFFLPHKRFGSTLETRCMNQVLRYCSDYGKPNHEDVVTNNMAGLLRMTPEQIRNIRKVGEKGSKLLTEALQPLRNRFYERQPDDSVTN